MTLKEVFDMMRDNTRFDSIYLFISRAQEDGAEFVYYDGHIVEDVLKYKRLHCAISVTKEMFYNEPFWQSLRDCEMTSTVLHSINHLFSDEEWKVLKKLEFNQKTNY